MGTKVSLCGFMDGPLESVDKVEQKAHSFHTGDTLAVNCAD